MAKLTKEQEGTAENPFTTMPEHMVTEEKAPVEITERQLKKDYDSFKKYLASEEHVNIMIPPTQLYPEGSSMPVCVNGVTYTIPVGIDFEKGVPKSIYQAWKNSYDADKSARDKMRKKLTGMISIG